MTDINIRSDSVDVEQIMRQIRARIREKRGVDYTEEEIRQLAAVKLVKPAELVKPVEPDRLVAQVEQARLAVQVAAMS